MTARIISTDDHVVEPADVWQPRLPAKYREVGPRVVRKRDDRGDFCDWWLYEDLKKPIPVEGASIGLESSYLRKGVTCDAMRRGCFDPVERIKDMDLNGVEASLCFPNILPRFCGQTFLEA